MKIDQARVLARKLAKSNGINDVDATLLQKAIAGETVSKSEFSQLKTVQGEFESSFTPNGKAQWNGLLDEALVGIARRQYRKKIDQLGATGTGIGVANPNSKSRRLQLTLYFAKTPTKAIPKSFDIEIGGRTYAVPVGIRVIGTIRPQ